MMTTSPAKRSPSQRFDAAGPRRRTRSRACPSPPPWQRWCCWAPGVGDGEPDDRGERVVTDDVSESTSSAITTGAALREVGGRNNRGRRQRPDGDAHVCRLEGAEVGFGMDVTGEYSGDVSHVTLGYDSLPEDLNDPTTDVDDAMFGTTEMITTADAVGREEGRGFAQQCSAATLTSGSSCRSTAWVGSAPLRRVSDPAAPPPRRPPVAAARCRRRGRERRRGAAPWRVVRPSTRSATSLERIADGATDQLDDETGSDLSDLRSMFEDQLGEELPGGEIPVDVWVCDDGLIHKIELTSAMGEGPDEKPDAGMTMSLEMYDLGVDFEIAVPTDAEELGLDDLLGGVTEKLEGISGLPKADTTD